MGARFRGGRAREALQKEQAKKLASLGWPTLNFMENTEYRNKKGCYG